MRIFLTLWFVPLALFWGWYALSANDISFGFHMLSRNVHDLVFEIYANMLGMEPESIPGVVAAACAFDTAIVMGIAAIKWRASWLPKAKETFRSYWGEDHMMDTDEEFTSEYSSNGRVHPAE
ncbi:MAG: DUF6105 family protein [Salaquimonas sp.]